MFMGCGDPLKDFTTRTVYAIGPGLKEFPACQGGPIDHGRGLTGSSWQYRSANHPVSFVVALVKLPGERQFMLAQLCRITLSVSHQPRYEQRVTQTGMQDRRARKKAICKCLVQI